MFFPPREETKKTTSKKSEESILQKRSSAKEDDFYVRRLRKNVKKHLFFPEKKGIFWRNLRKEEKQNYKIMKL
ncbi:hypothetical protein DLM75_16520 [Leptospira stimsonii]|uniref:Uncharacterized protein n=1 Tax=Leptospira stimsonii TaxID=2202203 RepID=A0A396Z763_9LEPT|nr:hypothetical protein DLM75_16520 [Leptospira stimsonii]